MSLVLDRITAEPVVLAPVEESTDARSSRAISRVVLAAAGWPQPDTAERASPRPVSPASTSAAPPVATPSSSKYWVEGHRQYVTQRASHDDRAHYKTTNTTHTETADSTGHADVPYQISGATAGYRVVADVAASSGKTVVTRAVGAPPLAVSAR